MNLTRKQIIHGNWAGKSYFETWPEFAARHIRYALCRVFGHTKPMMKMDAPKGICGRCRIVL